MRINHHHPEYRPYDPEIASLSKRHLIHSLFYSLKVIVERCDVGNVRDREILKLVIDKVFKGDLR